MNQHETSVETELAEVGFNAGCSARVKAMRVKLNKQNNVLGMSYVNGALHFKKIGYVTGYDISLWAMKADGSKKYRGFHAWQPANKARGIRIALPKTKDWRWEIKTGTAAGRCNEAHGSLDVMTPAGLAARKLRKLMASPFTGPVGACKAKVNLKISAYKGCFSSLKCTTTK